MKDKKKTSLLWSDEFKLKVVLDIIENESSYSQAAHTFSSHKKNFLSINTYD